MKQDCLFLFFLFRGFISFSQNISPELQSLINTENNFAAFSKSNNTREAFLKNTNDSSVVFSDGRPVNGKEFWKNRKVDDTYLFWWPVYADVSASGDLGFTTGPFVWGSDKNNPKPADGGYYFTVWKKDKDSQWKIAADLGSGLYDSSQFYLTIVRTDTFHFNSNKKINEASEEQKNIFYVEKDYVSKLNESNRSFILNYLSHNVQLYRPGQNPYLTIASTRKCINAEGKMKFTFEYSGGCTAQSSDLAYSYGIVKYVMIKEGKEQEMKANYLRAWKKENSKDWKIVVDVIGE